MLKGVFIGTLTTVVDDKFIRLIDQAIASKKLYSSRSEFIKEAVRDKLYELTSLDKDLVELRKSARKMALQAVKNGWDGSLLTREDKIKAANDLFRKKGWIK